MQIAEWPYAFCNLQFSICNLQSSTLPVCHSRHDRRAGVLPDEPVAHGLGLRVAGDGADADELAALEVGGSDGGEALRFQPRDRVLGVRRGGEDADLDVERLGALV